MAANDQVTETPQARKGDEEKFNSLDEVFQKAGLRYSFCVLLISSVMMMNPGLMSLAQVFTAAKMDFSCAEYQFGNSDELKSSSSCQIDYDKCSATFNCSDGGVARSAACVSFEFNDTIFQQTVISRFQLVCNRWISLFLAVSSFFIGYLFGSTFYGRWADKFGRLKLLAIGGINLGIGTAAASQMPYLWLYCCAQVISGFGVSGIHSVLYTYTIEMASSNLRHMWGFSVHHGWAGGVLFGTLLAYFVRDYQQLLLFYTLVAVPLLLKPFVLCESPRWLCSVGRFHEADIALRRIASFSGKELGENFSSKKLFDLEGQEADTGMSLLSLKSETAANSSSSFSDLLVKPGIRRLSLSLWFMFFTSATGFYGVPFSVADLGGNLFLNQLFSAVVEIPARIIGSFICHHITRRSSMIASCSVAGLSLIITSVLFQMPQLLWLRITVAMIGKFSFTIAMDLVYLYSGEAYPTVIRNLGVGSGSSFAKLAGLLSAMISQLAVLWKPLPFVVYGVAPLSGALVAYTLPETKGRRLPDTLEEGEAFVRGQRGLKLRARASKGLKKNILEIAY